MNNDFEKLVNKDEYQVFLFACPAYFPFSIFRHPWLVVNKRGEISRWEVRNILNKENNKYLYKNFQEPFDGIQRTFFVKRKWKAHLLSELIGPIAGKVIEWVENSELNYPYLDRYFLTGPNSNTYVQWVIDKFPEFNVKLSWRFIGKNYKIK